jgi:translation initiation factor IF-1
MAGKSAFEVEGVVTEALPGQTYRVELPNGHAVRAFVAGRAVRNRVRFAPGERVKLHMSPYDLSEGRIVVETKQI